MKRAFFLMVLLGLAVIAPLARAQQAEQSEREAMYYRYLEFASYIKGGSIEPHWMADGRSFWYAEGAPANTVIYKVDPQANTKVPMFDTVRLRQALTPVLGHEPPYQGLPFEEFTFVDEREMAVKFTVETNENKPSLIFTDVPKNNEFIVELDTYKITKALALSEAEKSRSAPLVVRPGEHMHQVLSPDGRSFLLIKDYNLWLRSTYDERVEPLTTDGIQDYEWDYFHWGEATRIWSPDGFKLVLRKEDWRKVPKIPIIHWLKPTEEVEWARFENARPRTDGPAPRIELFFLDILSKRQIQIDIGDDPGQRILILGWQSDGSDLFFLRINREYKKLNLMAANPATGATRVILTETHKPVVMNWWEFPGGTRLFTRLKDSERFIWMSERDGWRHLYLYDLDGTLIRRLTEGTFPALRVVAVDEKAGWVYFTAHGDQQRPYDTHLYRVDLRGKGFARLTEAKGLHDIHFAPAENFFLDTHSSVDRPPVVELRQADGKLLQTLSKANIDALKDVQWRPPEEFVVKAADGKTDLYGVLYKPYDFDPNKKYPVIEAIYAGAQFSEVPHGFTHPHGLWNAEHAQALAQLGFITFVVDGRGTPERGKVFQGVVYRNVGRYVIPDHSATLKQLAETRPYMDLSRVGIFGHSSGGANTVRALLIAPDIYHVGVAIAAGFNPYEDDNLRLVQNLKGKLLLIAGTNDLNVPFSTTMKMVEALIRAGKPHDLIVLPEQPHFFTGKSFTYFLESVRRYFQEHLKPERVVMVSERQAPLK